MSPHGGPRRLSTCTPSRPRAAATHRRKGADEDSEAARQGRKRKASPARSAAATCKRRTWRASMRADQHSTAPGAPLARACSAAHRVSLAVPGATTTSRARSIPEFAQLGACTTCGGATRTIHFPSACTVVNAGRSNEHSPCPAPSASTSVSAPRAQPPPGSSLSSGAKPLATVVSAAPTNRSPRQTSERFSTSARETVFILNQAPCLAVTKT